MKRLFTRFVTKQKQKKTLEKITKPEEVLQQIIKINSFKGGVIKLLTLPTILFILAGFLSLIPTKTQAQETTPPSAPTILIPETKNITTAQPLIAGVSENDTVVKIYVDEALTGQVFTENHPSGVGNFFWPITTPLSIGEHSIQVNATNINTQTVSNLSTAFIINVVPFGGPTLILPDQVNLTKAFSVIEGVAHSNSTIKIFIDSTQVDSLTVGEHPSNAVGFKFKLTNPLRTGQHTIYLLATDETGRQSLPSPQKTINIINFPAPTITTPANNSKTSKTNPTIAGVAFNNSLIQILVNETLEGTTAVTNHPSGVGYFSYTMQNSLTRGKNYQITTKAQGPKGRISPESKSVNLIIEHPYIPPTLLKITEQKSRPLISGVAHNDSVINILVDNQVDSTITPTNHPSGTLYFETQLSQPLSEGRTHKISAQTFDYNNKPSEISNILYYTYNVPTTEKKNTQKTTTTPPIKEGMEVSPVQTEAETPETTTEEEKETPVDISVKEEESGEIVEVAEPEEGQIKVPDEEEGKIVEEEEEMLAEEEMIPPTATNWPLIIGLIILIALAIIFIGWYLGQKRKLLNEGIDKLFSEEIEKEEELGTAYREPTAQEQLPLEPPLDETTVATPIEEEEEKSEMTKGTAVKLEEDKIELPDLAKSGQPTTFKAAKGLRKKNRKTTNLKGEIREISEDLPPPPPAI